MVTDRQAELGATPPNSEVADRHRPTPDEVDRLDADTMRRVVHEHGIEIPHFDDMPIVRQRAALKEHLSGAA